MLHNDAEVCHDGVATTGTVNLNVSERRHSDSSYTCVSSQDCVTCSDNNAATGSIELNHIKRRPGEPSSCVAANSAVTSASDCCGSPRKPAAQLEEQQALPAYLSFCPCVEDSVPMVALECELPLSGRLSLPAEGATSFLSEATSGHVIDMVSGHPDPGSQGAGYVSEPYTIGAPAPPCRKRKLPASESEDSYEDTSDDGDDESMMTAEYRLSCVADREDGSALEIKRRKLEPIPLVHFENGDCVEVEVRYEEHCQRATHVDKQSHHEHECCEQWEKDSHSELMKDSNSERMEDSQSEHTEVSHCENMEDSHSEHIGDLHSEHLEKSTSDESTMKDILQREHSDEHTDSMVDCRNETVDMENVMHEEVHLSVSESDSDANDSESAAAACEPSQSCTDVSDDHEQSCSEHRTSLYRTPRISPFLNTPKQRKEERRKILKLSIHKMRAVEDPEHFLRRSVLINNTMKRLQRELREEKLRRGNGGYGSLYRRVTALHNESLNNSYLLQDESPFTVGETDRITDDMTDALVTRLETAPVTSTQSPSPAPTSSCSPSPSQQQAQSAFSPVTSSVSLCTSSPVISSTTSSSRASARDDDADDDMYHDEVFTTTPPVLRETTVSTSCSSESQREKQLYADMDTVFNNLIRALGDS